MKDREHATLDALAQALAQPREPKIVRATEEFAYLQRLVARGLSKQARRWLEKRAGQGVQFWMRQLRIKRGRPADPRLTPLYRYGALLRRENPRKYSWSALAKKIDPKGYGTDPTRTRDRIRKGIEAALQKGIGRRTE